MESVWWTLHWALPILDVLLTTPSESTCEICFFFFLFWNLRVLSTWPVSVLFCIWVCWRKWSLAGHFIETYTAWPSIPTALTCVRIAQCQAAAVSSAGCEHVMSHWFRNSGNYPFQLLCQKQGDPSVAPSSSVKPDWKGNIRCLSIKHNDVLSLYK